MRVLSADSSTPAELPANVLPYSRRLGAPGTDL